MNRTRAYWICQIAGWSTYAVLNLGLFLLVRGSEDLSTAVLSLVLLVATGVGLTHGFRWFVRRRQWVGLPLRRLVPRVLLASLVLSLCLQVLFRLLYTLPMWEHPPHSYASGIAVATFVNLAIIFLLWSLIYFSVHYFWNYKAAEIERWQLEAAVKDAELKALRAQVNPHFLFNSLNSVRALIVEDPARAQEVVTQLAGLLRYALQAGATPTVPLEAELEAVRTYLALESIRLEERLRYHVDLDDAVRRIPVPPMLVQTLVENGIKYGVATLPAGGAVTVTAHRNGTAACIRVVNTGRLQAPAASTGVGLRNATERLRLLFGDAAALSLANTEDDTVTAEVRIPLGD